MPHLDELRLPRCVAGPLSGGPCTFSSVVSWSIQLKCPGSPTRGISTFAGVSQVALCASPGDLLQSSLRRPETQPSGSRSSAGPMETSPEGWPPATRQAGSRTPPAGSRTHAGVPGGGWVVRRAGQESSSGPHDTPAATSRGMRTSRCSGDLLALCEGWDSGRRSRPAGGRWGQSAAPPRASRAQGGP